MTFDVAKVPGGDVARWGTECRDRALAGVAAGDWRPVYDWTKSWIGWGGGAWVPDTWILYAVSALLQGKPCIAVHGIDLGLRVWLEGETDRAALTWLRGTIVMDRLQDPKTALLDLEDSIDLLPIWLTDHAADRLERCRDEATRSRKRVPSVQPRPRHTGSDQMAYVVAPAVDERADGHVPTVWPQVATYFRQV